MLFSWQSPLSETLWLNALQCSQHKAFSLSLLVMLAIALSLSLPQSYSLCPPSLLSHSYIFIPVSRYYDSMSCADTSTQHMLSQTPVVSVHTDAGSGGIVLHVISGCQLFLQELSGIVSFNIFSRVCLTECGWIQMLFALLVKSYSESGSINVRLAPLHQQVRFASLESYMMFVW